MRRIFFSVTGSVFWSSELAFERKPIRGHSLEGREKAIARGVKFDAKLKLNKKEIQDLIKDFEAPSCSKIVTAEDYGSFDQSGP